MLLATAFLCGLYRDRLPEGPERGGADALIARVRRLSHWFGRLVERQQEQETGE